MAEIRAAIDERGGVDEVNESETYLYVFALAIELLRARGLDRETAGPIAVSLASEYGRRRTSEVEQ